MSKEKRSEDSVISKTRFHLSQTSGTAKEVKDMVRAHAIDTRRELKIVKNDKERIRVICEGKLVAFDPNVNVGPSNIDAGARPINNEAVGPSKKKPKTDKRVGPQDEPKKKNTKIDKGVGPTLQSELQRTFQLGLSKQKAQRAKRSAQGQLRGDYTRQYNMLRDYVLELHTSNPESTIKLEVEPPMNPESNERIFKRIYVCLGALKRGFKTAGRELLGLDGAFMSGPFPGQVLTAVSIDSNNGIYPVAYAVVEAETTNSWTWFLECLGDDLDLDRRSNYTFMSDRQKGIIQAIAKVFPCAEHRYCLKHIHENMKLQWRGTAFKNHVWKCASATTVPEFNKCMLDLKNYSEPAYKWLLKIPPQHWARSHFTGRAKSDVLLNNMCEVLNSKLVKGRAMPIIHCLEYIREYLMIRIDNVRKVIAKSKGPLTPTATRIFEWIKTEAESYKAIFNGTDKYQVSGPWGDQCVVNMTNMTCSCRKWEITAMPCKHAVAVHYNMVNNGVATDVVEAWVDPYYRLDTWKLMYQFTINPTNGMNMWAKAPEHLTLIIPPKYHTPVGRPRKKRRKNAEEIQMSKNGKLSRKLRSVVCKNCDKMGHNKRSCQNVGSSQPNPNASQSNQAREVASQSNQAREAASQPNATPSQTTQPRQAASGAGSTREAGAGAAGASQASASMGRPTQESVSVRTTKNRHRYVKATAAAHAADDDDGKKTIRTMNKFSLISRMTTKNTRHTAEAVGDLV
uniref:uncharacterized protein LOC122597298 n=1 Tax=Erigeron canadensis TaxID=72917 RepID=UPI001CB9206E|nr:uncharacterized protein LOC122597298 [Erigeron canadensis]